MDGGAPDDLLVEGEGYRAVLALHVWSVAGSDLEDPVEVGELRDLVAGVAVQAHVLVEVHFADREDGREDLEPEDPLVPLLGPPNRAERHGEGDTRVHADWWRGAAPAGAPEAGLDWAERGAAVPIVQIPIITLIPWEQEAVPANLDAGLPGQKELSLALALA